MLNQTIDGNTAFLDRYMRHQDKHNAGFDQILHDKKIEARAKTLADDCILDFDDMAIDELIDLSSEWRDFAEFKLPQSADEMNLKEFHDFGRAAHALLWKLQQKLIEKNMSFAEEELS